MSVNNLKPLFVCVDMQEAFFANVQRIPVPHGTELAQRINTVTGALSCAGTPTLWLFDASDSVQYLRHTVLAYDPQSFSEKFIARNLSSRPFLITPREGDFILVKGQNSGFVGTNLANFLRENEFQHRMWGGVKDYACVRESMCDASKMAGSLDELVLDCSSSELSANRADLTSYRLYEDRMASLNSFFGFNKFLTVTATEVMDRIPVRQPLDKKYQRTVDPT